MFLITIPFTIDAQIRWGVKAGVNTSIIYNKDYSWGFGTGFHAGGVMEYSFSRFFAFQPEILFSQNRSENSNFDSFLIILILS